MQSTHETWQAIPGYVGFYEASDQGRIRSIPRTLTSRNGLVRHFKGRVLAEKTTARGYKSVTLSVDNKPSDRHVHVLVALAFLGPRPDGHHVCHGNGLPGDNRLANLRYDTVSANHMDKVGHGTAPRGERSGRHILTAEQVRQVRDALRAGGRHRDIAERYGVARTAVTAINLGKTWAWLD